MDWPGAVDLLDEASRGVVPVQLGAPGEVLLADQPAGLVVGVAPGGAELVGHRRHAQVAVVRELQPGPVRIDPRGGLVEAGVLEARDLPGRAHVRDEVALAVVAPALGRTVGQDARAEQALQRPGEAGDVSLRSGLRHETAERIALEARGGALRVGHPHRHAGGVGVDPCGPPGGVGDRAERSDRVVGVGDAGAGGIGLAGQIAGLVVLHAPDVAVRLRHRHGQPVRAVLRPGRGPVGTDHRQREARLVVHVQGGVPQGVGTRPDAVVAVPGAGDRVPERIGLGDQLAELVELVDRRVAGEVGRRGAPVRVVVGVAVLQQPVGAGREHHPAPVVVLVAVPRGVAVLPGDDAVVVVVPEGQRCAGGVGDAGEISAAS